MALLKPIILFEDEHIIVCEKPAGIATQTKNTRELDLESLIKRSLYQKNPKNGEPYISVIHRLDQPVRGILVFAKTQVASKNLNQQLQSHGFGKHYKALLSSKPTSKSETLTHFMKKDSRTNISSICDEQDPEGKKAVLHYEIMETPQQEDIQLFAHCKSNLEMDELSTLVKIRLETGRHHQIRGQLAAIGCSICGDTKYGKDMCQDTSSSSSQWNFVCLCAYKLNFEHPITKKAMSFSL